MSPRRDGDEGGAPPGLAGASVKGAVLIAVAVAVGIVLLGRGFDSGILPATSESPSEEADPGDDEPDDDTEDGGNGTTTTATTTGSVAQDPAAVRVIALNGTGLASGEPVGGVASAGSTALETAGYTNILEGANTTAVATTTVFFAPGLDADASAVATALGLAPTAIAPLPAPPPEGVPAEAQVAVVFGDDQMVVPPAG